MALQPHDVLSVLRGVVGCVVLVVSGHSVAPWLQAQASPAALANGVVIEKVPCLEDLRQSYALYLPSSYTPQRRRPIIYAFDPGAQGTAPVQMLKNLAETYGYIVTGSNNSRNGPIKDQMDAAQAMWRDAHARFSIDDRRQYATGFSGGARAAALFAFLCNRCVAGVIAHGAGLPPTEPSPEKAYFAYFLAIGDLDFNYAEVVELRHQLDALGVANRLRVFPGPHQWAPQEVWAEAIEWMELLAMKEGRRPKDEPFVSRQLSRVTQRASELEHAGNLYEAYQEYRALLGEYAGLADTSVGVRKVAELKDSPAVREGAKREQEEINEQRRLSAGLLAGVDALYRKSTVEPGVTLQLLSKLEDLRSKVQGEKDKGKGRAARRALSHVFARSYENGVQALLEKQFSLAETLLEFSKKALPGSPAPYYQLARAYAGAGKNKKALASLREAMARGLRSAALLQKTAEFASLKDEKGFKKLLTELAATP